ncbi:uncharacterized protein LOC133190753 [Saccostrea echinata]|uniref:uncharacterized protein LOC133190753 n=1 Tax=Saccostrea echinata TaxID=191078 RepID=UPI002A81D1A3|nr:uncharacterized protein LOC133190753 [Saccostrea echinata]
MVNTGNMFRKFFVILIITCLLTQEVEGWRRIKKFFRRVGKFIKKEVPKIVHKVQQVKTVVDKAKSAHENIKDTFEKGKDAGERIESAGKAVKDAKDVIDIIKSLKKRSTIEETSQLNLCEFSTFDWNQDKKITEEELEILMEATGLLELDEFFENMDLDQDDTVTIEEFLNSPFINELCV